MEVAVYFAQLERLQRIEDALHSIDFRKMPSYILDLMYDDANSSEYLGNLNMLETVEAYVGRGDKPSRLYYGQEFCEYLVPEPAEIRQAYYTCRQLGWDFTYVTGYLTERALAKVKANLAVLREESGGCEVVVNDWGLLAVLAREFPDFQPVLGRLQAKQIRFARFEGAVPVNLNGISVPEAEIRANQQEALRGLNLSVPEYREWLVRMGIGRFEVDITPQGADVPEDCWGLGSSFYYPWAYVAGARNCLTASVVDPRRRHVPLNAPCPRPCRRFNKTTIPTGFPNVTIQRGNAVFVFNKDEATPYVSPDSRFDRVVMQPYIPI